MGIVEERERVFTVNPQKISSIIKQAYDKEITIQGYYNKSEVRVKLLLTEIVQNKTEVSQDIVKRILVGVKTPTSDPIVRMEQELLFDNHFANSFLESFVDYVIKTRYFLRIDNYKWEVDVYEGKLKGLLIAEIETSSKENSGLSITKLPIPAFCDQEVTKNPLYRNSKLAQFKNLDELHKKLEVS